MSLLLRALCRKVLCDPRISKACNQPVRHPITMDKSNLPTYLARGDQTHLGQQGISQMRPLSAVSPLGGEVGTGDKQASPARHRVLAKQQPGEEFLAGKAGGATPIFTPSTGDSVRDYSASETSGDAPPSRASGGSADHGPTTYIGVADAQGRRSYMEDRYTVMPTLDVGVQDGVPRSFVAVYDGHSSHVGSDHAKHRLHQFVAMQAAIRQCKGEPRSREEAEAVEEALKGAFMEADDEIVEKAVRTQKRYGTTAVCALRVGRVVYVAHAGDSRAVLCRDGKAVNLTKDHKPSTPSEAARIESQGGVIDYDADRVHSNPEGMRQSRLNMSRSLGDPDFKGPRRIVESEPDVARVVLKPGRDTFFLLGSDGLFDVMTNQEAVDCVQQLLAKGMAGGKLSGETVELAAQALVDRALKLKTIDNVTAIVVLAQWE